MGKSTSNNSINSGDSLILISEIVRVTNIVRETHFVKKPLYSLFLYTLLKYSVDFFKSIWSHSDYEILLSYSRKPSLFLQVESRFTSSEWIECLNLILRSPIAPNLVQRCNEDFVKHYEDGFFLEMFWAFCAKEVNSKERSRITGAFLNLGLKVTSLDASYAIELYGFSEELEALIFSSKEEIFNNHDCEFPLPTFIFGWNDEFSPEHIFKLFEKLIKTEKYVSDNSKLRYVTLSLKYFYMPPNKKEKIKMLCQEYIKRRDNIFDVIELVPTFPSLRELCRNFLYTYVKRVGKFNKSCEFHNALKCLQLPQTVIDEIRFKKPIYR